MNITTHSGNRNIFVRRVYLCALGGHHLETEAIPEIHDELVGGGT